MTDQEEKFTDFEIHISSDGKIKAISEQGERIETNPINEPKNIKLYLRLIETNQADEELLKEFGTILYDTLFTHNIHTHFTQTEAVARDQNINVRLRLNIEHDQLAKLPWEFTYREEGGYFLSVNPKTALSRYLNLPFPKKRLEKGAGPLHMLLIIAAPNDQRVLNPDEWEDIVNISLLKPCQEGSLTIETIKQGTQKNISETLLKQKPDIIQFIGYGLYRDGKEYLALVDSKTGGTFSVDGEKLANLFLGFDDNLRLVNLMTCKSAEDESPKVFLGIASQIVKREIPAVIVVRYKMNESATEIFLKNFYEAIASRKPVDWAMQWARNQVSFQTGLGSREFAAPVLYMRAKDGIIFPSKKTSQKPVYYKEPHSQEDTPSTPDSFEACIHEAFPNTFDDIKPIPGGEGGEGKVFSANHIEFKQKMAIKVLSNPNKRSIDDLQREGQITNLLRHSNIVVVHNLKRVKFKHQLVACLVMDFEEGGTLEKHILSSKEGLSLEKTRDIFVQICNAVEHAHKHNIIHRDLKPANILFDKEGNVKVVDFGVAKLLQREDANEKNTVVGTREYAAPEQFSTKSKKVDKRSDIYALGKILYEMLTNKNPREFVADAPNESLPSDIVKIIGKATEPDPEKRYQDVKDLRQAVVEVLPALPSDTLPLPDADIQSSTPTSKLVLSLDPSVYMFDSMPFDIGTIWGLDRRSFIGLIAGWKDDEIYEGLIHVERALYDAMKESRGFPFPIRWWIKIDISRTRYPNGPQKERDVWESADNPNSQLVRYLKESGIEGSIIPGFFFEVSAQEYNEAFSITLLKWCDKLINHFFLSREAAIVIHVTGNSIDESRRLVLNLHNKLRTIGLRTTKKHVEMLTPYTQSRITDRDKGLHGAISIDDTIMDIFGIAVPDITQEECGVYFYSWVKQALIKGQDKLRHEDEKKKYTRVLDIWKSYYQKYGTSQNDTSISGKDVSKVVFDLEVIIDALDPKIKGEVNREFFQLIEEYLPQFIGELIKACAKSRKREIQLDALRFAAGSDILMDAWIDGSGLDPQHLPKGKELFADPEKGLFVDDLALALLRKYHQPDAKKEEVKNLIEKLPHLSSNLKVVCDYSLGRLKERVFPKEYSIEEFRLIIRAGTKLQFLIEQFKYLRIDNPDLWWFLIATFLGKDQIIELLKLKDVKRRAVLGLCTANEWQQEIEKDTGLIEKIIDCRRLPGNI